MMRSGSPGGADLTVGAAASATNSRAAQAHMARLKGYVGDSCSACGNFTLVRNGTCLKCDTCDFELLAVYTASNLANGASLEDSLRQSIGEIDGVFTYLVATRDELGMAKDTMAAKPLVLYESDEMIAMASEEVAIRAILPQEIDTTDPYDEEVRVWRA